mmetsp:Transcript_5347/g.11693  ORF Transcript_5347/g.11693 Transcript_5347/m.11693 type:complete len:292 (+) Transcript_5347:1391-2266(+)
MSAQCCRASLVLACSASISALWSASASWACRLASASSALPCASCTCMPVSTSPASRCWLSERWYRSSVSASSADSWLARASWAPALSCRRRHSISSLPLCSLTEAVSSSASCRERCRERIWPSSTPHCVLAATRPTLVTLWAARSSSRESLSNLMVSLSCSMCSSCPVTRAVSCADFCSAACSWAMARALASAAAAASALADLLSALASSRAARARSSSPRAACSRTCHASSSRRSLVEARSASSRAFCNPATLSVLDMNLPLATLASNLSLFNSASRAAILSGRPLSFSN